MKVRSWLTFLFKSVALGLIVSLLILVLVPDLRTGSGSLAELFRPADKVPEKLSYYRAISEAAPAVVNIYSTSIDIRSSLVRRQQVNRTSLGSGVIMTDNGYILTCYHVIQNAVEQQLESIDVGLHDGRQVSAEVVGFDTVTDLAVLKISLENLAVIPQMEDPGTRVGDVVLAIGNPLNLGQTITQGIVSRTGRNYVGPTVSAYSVDFIQTDAVLNQGNSGGALVDSNGYLVGINNASFKSLDGRRQVRNVDGVFFSVPYKLARRIMNDIISTGRAAHGQLGFTGRQRAQGPGIQVDNVVPGGAADLAGLQEGDVVASINGISAENVTLALDIVANSSPGDVLTLSVERDEQRITIPITVAELGPINTNR